jgi:hypothetical protein
MRRNRRKQFVICIYNKGQEASLLLRKIYERIPDPDAERHGQIRVIDEEDEDYLHPANYFVPIELPRDIEKVVEEVAELELQRR